MRAKAIDIEHVNKMLSYDPLTGLFTRIFSVTRKDLIGKTAGARNRLGYICIRIGESDFLAHRLAWSVCNGPIPEDMYVDHIDGNPSNNKISNLRLAWQYENMQNLKRSHADSLSGVMGVTILKTHKRKKYMVQINRKSKKICKLFYTLEEAGQFYIEEKRRMHEFNTL